jgi:quercetin dioxygenase-like cupin family protein
MSLVTASERRRTETPNAVMTTLASPTQGGAGLSLWLVEMDPGQTGPEHRFDREQVWTVLAGTADVTVDGETVRAGAGDVVVLPARALRRIRPAGDEGLRAVVAGDPAARAAMADGTDRGTPPWIA